MTIRVALAAVILTTGIASAASPGKLKVGQEAFLSSRVLACPTHDIMVSILNLASQDFDAAVAKGTGEGCRTLDKGTEVIVSQLPKGVLVCVKPTIGKPCEWTAQARVKAYD